MSENKTPAIMDDIAKQQSQTAVTLLQPGGNQIAGQMGLAASLSRAEVDIQITTAKAYPRAHAAIQNTIHSLVALDDQSAEECVYAFSRGGKPIRGPSIRFAEIIASQWGNCRVAARVVHVDRVTKTIQAEGVFYDLETNTATTMRVDRRISDKNGKLFSDDMIAVTGNAACAIAKRNAILSAIPKAIWRGAFEHAEGVIAGDVETLVERREKMVKAFAAWGVSPDQIAAYLEIDSSDDISLDDIVTLRAIYGQIKDGHATVEEVFPAEKGVKEKKVTKPIDKQLADNEAKRKTKKQESGQGSTPPAKADQDKAAAEPEEGTASDGEATAMPDEAEATEENPTGKPEISEARKRGRDTAEQRLSRRAIPTEYRGDSEEAKQNKAEFEAGFDERIEELKGD